MPDRADLHGDQVIELVAPVWGGGQAEPAVCWDLFDRVLKGRRGNVMTLIGDYQPVSGGETGDVVASGQCLQGDDVDGAAELGAAAAELPGFDAEELADAGPPLVGQGLEVHEYQR
jgi:hypothetical protein